METRSHLTFQRKDLTFSLKGKSDSYDYLPQFGSQRVCVRAHVLVCVCAFEVFMVNVQFCDNQRAVYKYKMY